MSSEIWKGLATKFTEKWKGRFGDEWHDIIINGDYIIDWFAAESISSDAIELIISTEPIPNTFTLFKSIPGNPHAYTNPVHNGAEFQFPIIQKATTKKPDVLYLAMSEAS